MLQSNTVPVEPTTESELSDRVTAPALEQSVVYVPAAAYTTVSVASSGRELTAKVSDAHGLSALPHPLTSMPDVLMYTVASVACAATARASRQTPRIVGTVGRIFADNLLISSRSRTC